MMGREDYLTVFSSQFVCPGFKTDSSRKEVVIGWTAETEEGSVIDEGEVRLLQFDQQQVFVTDFRQIMDFIHKKNGYQPVWIALRANEEEFVYHSYFAKRLMNVTPEEFYDENFWTVARAKVVSGKYKDFLYMEGSSTLKADLCFRASEEVKIARGIKLMSSDVEGSTKVFEIDFENLADEVDGDLISVNVYDESGKRSMEYFIDHTMFDSCAFYFDNCFGKKELMEFKGAPVTEKERDSESAWVNGRFRVFDVHVNDVVELESGALSLKEFEFVGQLMEADDVVWLNKGEALKIGIEDCEIKGIKGIGSDYNKVKFKFRPENRGLRISVDKKTRVHNDNFNINFN